MEELNLTQMLQMQMSLWEKHKESWSPIEPKYARDSLLWMIEEVGEVISLIKKHEEEAISSTPALKAHFTEELCDVLMYYLDVLNRYHISGRDLSEAFAKKHAKNMQRDYDAQYLAQLNAILHPKTV